MSKKPAKMPPVGSRIFWRRKGKDALTYHRSIVHAHNAGFVLLGDEDACITHVSPVWIDPKEIDWRLAEKKEEKA